MKNMKNQYKYRTILLLMVLLSSLSISVHAQMATVLNTTLKGEITAGGKGTTATSSTFLISKPTGATTANKVFLYISNMNGNTDANCTINGVNLTLTESGSSTASGYTNICYYNELSTSTTAAPIINALNTAAAGSNITFSFTESPSNTTVREGIGMIVLWDVPTMLYPGTHVIQLGSLPSGPTGASSSFAIAPLDKSLSGFKAVMGVGITFSTGSSGQTSVLSIGSSSPTTVISSNCGGYDDGEFANGALFTLGGYGDSPTLNSSDELFDVASYLVNGQTNISYRLLDVDNVYDDHLNALYFTSSGIIPPCLAGTTAPAVTPTTAINSCPATTVDLTSLAISSTTPSGASLIWSTHKTPTSAADTLTTAQKTAVSTAGTYYALYYDATNACYSPADSVTLTITSCVPPFSASNPAAQTATTGAAKTGNAATELAPTGGVSPYIYSNGAGDAACVAPSGATLLTGLTVNSNGTYSYTAPTTAGTYYYCIKVCDSATPTASCVVKTYTLTVTAAASCNAGTVAPMLIKN